MQDYIIVPLSYSQLMKVEDNNNSKGLNSAKIEIENFKKLYIKLTEWSEQKYNNFMSLSLWKEKQFRGENNVTVPTHHFNLF